MPEAQQYGDLRVRTRPQDAALVNPGIASADAMGAAIGQGARGLAIGIGQASQIKQAEQDKRDETDAMDALNGYMDARNEDMAGYLARTKKDAIGLPDEARKGYESRRDEAAKNLQSPGAKEIFSRLAARRWTEEDRTIQGHVVGQVKAYQADTFEGTIERLRQDAISSGDPAEIEKAASMQYVTRQRLADLMGEDAQTTEIKHRADRSALYGGHTQSLLADGDYKGAADYFETIKDRIDPDARRSLEPAIRSGRLNYQAQAVADEVMRDPAQTRAKAYEMVNGLTDPEVRQRTLANVNRAFAEREAVKAEAQGSSYEDLAKQIEAGASVADLESQAGPKWEALDQRDRDALRHVEHNTLNRKSPGELSDHYYELSTLAAELPDEFMAHDFRREKGILPESERAKLIQQQVEMKAGRTKGITAKAPRGILSADDVANQTLQSLPDPIPTGLKDGKMDPRAIAFRRLYDKALIAAGGADKLSAPEMRQIADKLVIQEAVKKDRSIFNPLRWIGSSTYDDKVMAFEAPGADLMAFATDQIPTAERARARAALVKAGIANPTDEQVLDTYNAAIRGEAK